MRFFKSASTGAVHAYDDDVTAVADASGVYAFFAADGMPLQAPADLQPCAEPAAVRPSEAQRMRILSDRVQQWLDATAQGDGYYDIGSAVTYAEEPVVPAFQAQGRRYRAWRSLVWAAYYSILDEWRSGTRAEPTPEQLIAELPVLDSVDGA